jgi:hypothetical protein
MEPTRLDPKSWVGQGSSLRRFIFIFFILKKTQIVNMKTNINLWYIVNIDTFVILKITFFLVKHPTNILKIIFRLVKVKIFEKKIILHLIFPNHKFLFDINICETNVCTVSRKLKLKNVLRIRKKTFYS